MLFTRYVEKSLFGQLTLYLNFIFMMQTIITCGAPNLVIRNIKTDLAISRSPILTRLLIQQALISFPIIVIAALYLSFNLYVILCVYMVSLANFYLLIIRYYSRLILYNLLSGSLFAIVQISLIPILHFELITKPYFFTLILSILFLILCYLSAGRLSIYQEQHRTNIKSKNYNYYWS